DYCEFMDMYNANRDQAIYQGIESDPFASAIVELMKHNQEWVGNAYQLIAEAGRYADERTRNSKAFPVARTVRNRLKRINPSLRKKGIDYEPEESKKHRTLKLERYAQTSSLAPPSSPMPTNQRFEGYDVGDYKTEGYDTSSPGDDNNKTSSPYKDGHIKVGADGYDNDDVGSLNSKNDMDISI